MKKMPDFIIASSLVVQDRHWLACTAANKPYIRVAPRRKYADVVVDFWSTDADMAEEIWTQLKEIVVSATLPGGYIYAGKTMVATTKTPKETAHILAKRLAGIAMEYCKQRGNTGSRSCNPHLEARLFGTAAAW